MHAYTSLVPWPSPHGTVQCSKAWKGPGIRLVYICHIEIVLLSSEMLRKGLETRLVSVYTF